MWRVVYTPEAEAELLEVVPFYGAPADQADDPFLAAIDRDVRRIAANPQQFPVVGRDIRRCVVRKYPFIIFFRQHADHLRILAVAHTSRHPDYWKSRI